MLSGAYPFAWLAASIPLGIVYYKKIKKITETNEGYLSEQYN